MKDVALDGLCGGCPFVGEDGCQSSGDFRLMGT